MLRAKRLRNGCGFKINRAGSGEPVLPEREWGHVTGQSNSIRKKANRTLIALNNRPDDLAFKHDIAIHDALAGAA